MKKPLLTLIFVFVFCLFALSQEVEKRIYSSIDSSYPGELVLIQDLTINAPIAKVWEAYTTKKGWESWSVPLAEIDFKIGGTIKTNYNPNGQIGDSTTIVTHIINYVPYRLITLQAEITNNFPEFMKKEAKNFYNIIYFNELSEGKTKVRSFGIGYRNNPKYLKLIKFFIPANEKTLKALISYLED